jgi:hypothetical protein
MAYKPMYEAAYSLVAAISRVKGQALAPTQQQMSLIVTNLSLLRAGHDLTRARLRSIALGEVQDNSMRLNLHFITLDRILGQVFNGKNGI